jgi:hypothetical protein
MSRAGKPGQDTSGSPGDFLERWSRRKTGARDGAARPDNTGAVTVPPPVEDADVTPVQEQEPVLTDADMPPVETLDAESDFTPFMSPGVSDDLRQKALRILFRNPAFNMVDGLNDYDEDYTQFAGLGSIVTHEMKRMLKRELEVEENRQANAADRQQEAQPAGADVPAAEPELVDQTPDPSQTAANGQLDMDADDKADSD